MERLKKDFETLAEEAIENIRADRDQTKELLKYVETLQRSNEQLVKIVSLQKKSEIKETALSEDERNEIFEQLNKEVK